MFWKYTQQAIFFVEIFVFKQTKLDVDTYSHMFLNSICIIYGLYLRRGHCLWCFIAFSLYIYRNALLILLH